MYEDFRSFSFTSVVVGVFISTHNHENRINQDDQLLKTKVTTYDSPLEDSSFSSEIQGVILRTGGSNDSTVTLFGLAGGLTDLLLSLFYSSF